MIHTAFEDAFFDGLVLRETTGDTVTMTTRVLGNLRIHSGAIAAADPLTMDFDGSSGRLDRELPNGEYPLEIAIARFGHDQDQRVACARVRFADKSAVRWQSAKPAGAPELEEDEGNVVMFSSGTGDGCYESYWGFDEAGELVELATDFEVLIENPSQSVEVPLPTKRGRIEHPLLKQYGVTARAPLFSRRTIILGGKGMARVELSDRSPVQMKDWPTGLHYSWASAGPDAHAIIHLFSRERRPLAHA